jgi:hypothetical protein
LLFICQEHSLNDKSEKQTWSSILLFIELRLAFDFRFDLCSDLVISFHQGVFWPLVHIGFHQKSCL